MRETCKRKILLVDDDEDFLGAIKEFLKGLGYEVITANNGKKAIEKANSEKPDVILLDVIIPEKNGFEVCEELKSGDETKEIKVILMSGKIKEIEKGFDYGADDCIIKPVDWNRLPERIEDK